MRSRIGIWSCLALSAGLVLAGNTIGARGAGTVTEAEPLVKRSPTERLQREHLKATHEDALRYQQQRRSSLQPSTYYHDYKAILHAHAEDSAHTGGTRAEMLADAKKAGVQIIMLTDHLRPPRDFINDSWHGLHDGVLFIPGSEARGFLVYPTRSIMDEMEMKLESFVPSVTDGNGLIFLSHIEERPEASVEGLTGMEICNRHYDAKRDAAGLTALAMKMLDPAKLAQLQESVRLYPDEVLAAQVDYAEVYLKKWDAELGKHHHLTGVAANDCHHNQILILKMVDENTVLLGTNVDKDEGMHRFTADGHPGIRKLTEGHKPGEIIARIDFDPYYRSFRNMTTHIWAHDLTDGSVRAALQEGRAYVSHDWMCDATGFFFAVFDANQDKREGNLVLSGGATNFIASTGSRTQMMKAYFPVACHAKLLRNGSVIAESDADLLPHEISEPGVYRVEGWLKLDGELRPWIYSNPIDFKPPKSSL
jgi:hypothetical protein